MNTPKINTVGFVGLGNMGGPMASNLVKAGMIVVGSDVTPAAQEKAAAAGIQVLPSAAEVAQAADIVFTSLPNGALVNAVVEELLQADARPHIIVDCSTISVAETRDLAAKLSNEGIGFLDAPISGGVKGAQEATLAFMVGGSAEHFEAVRPFFEAMGRSVTHCGEVGNGQAVKACNNMILAVQQIVLAEAIVLGERLGLDHQAFFDVVSNATGNSWSLSVNAPVPGVVPSSPANNEFAPGFAASLMLKDLLLAMDAAELTSTDTVLGKIAATQYQQFVEQGNGGLDFSAIINEVRSR